MPLPITLYGARDCDDTEHTRAFLQARGVPFVEVASVPHISHRYLVAFIYPITATIRPFLAKKGHSPEEVEKMHQAWFKSVVMQVVLWSAPYGREGDF